MFSTKRHLPPSTLTFIVSLPIPSFHSGKIRHLSQRRPRYSKSRVPLAANAPGQLQQTASSSGIRINKCFKSFASRRQSDAFVDSGRVNINGHLARQGARVLPGDIVELDGKVIDWQRLTIDVSTTDFIYLKHWKLPGVICTTDPTIPNNIIDHIDHIQFSEDRIFPVGRLDEPSTGIILLTSDGRLPNAVLGGEKKCPKEYLVMPDMYVSDDHMQQLRDGVEITTIAQRDGNVRIPRTSYSLPCDVERREGFQLLIRLFEGRNRQIRKMLGALGYTTRDIHRISFMGISLDGLVPGSTCRLDEKEMLLIQEKLRAA